MGRKLFIVSEDNLRIYSGGAGVGKTYSIHKEIEQNTVSVLIDTLYPDEYRDIDNDKLIIQTYQKSDTKSARVRLENVVNELQIDNRFEMVALDEIHFMEDEEALSFFNTMKLLCKAYPDVQFIVASQDKEIFGRMVLNYV